MTEAKFFTVLADENKDISKAEQLSAAFQYVFKSSVHERFTGYIHAKSLTALALSEYIFSRITDYGLDVDKLVSQCYDGASVMSGCNNDVQAIIKNKCKQAVHILCHAHKLNLVLVDVVKKVPLAYEFFELMELVYVYVSIEGS